MVQQVILLYLLLPILLVKEQLKIIMKNLYSIIKKILIREIMRLLNISAISTPLQIFISLEYQ
jgi:hypothetical protein